jgi:hypothetical protein
MVGESQRKERSQRKKIHPLKPIDLTVIKQRKGMD